jgi:hypothetical protein
MGYRGLPLLKHGAWDSFRRPRGLASISECVKSLIFSFKKSYLYLFTARAAARPPLRGPAA